MWAQCLRVESKQTGEENGSQARPASPLNTKIVTYFQPGIDRSIGLLDSATTERLVGFQHVAASPCSDLVMDMEEERADDGRWDSADAQQLKPLATQPPVQLKLDAAPLARGSTRSRDRTAF